ncbi:hypothetical protein [Planctomycetes bacterium K23_9]|uniref:Uncharacterized protein n=1 Tax=Stieleria marina TaxID=1930275 RepID=A0A517NVU2_9BACT|nr:hypothetical protein K239x_32220 [Planctomycetes bacterium K23_9]
MLRYVPTALSCLMVLSCAWADEPCSGVDAPKSKPNAKPSARITATTCKFTFPVDDLDQTWEWGVSPLNACEYSWMVTVKLKEATFQIGVSHFNAFGIAQSGSFDDFLRASQADVWKLKPDKQGATVVDGIKVICKSNGPALEITVDDADWSAAVFAQRPALVKLQTTGTRLKKSEHAVKIKYKSD